MSSDHHERVRGARAMVLGVLTGVGQLRKAVRRHQEGDATASSTAPDGVRELLSDGRLAWVQFPPAVLTRLTCPHFNPNVFALVVPEKQAITLIESSPDRDIVPAVLVDIRSSGKAGLAGQELALIVYADTPPIGYPPNTPVAIYTLGMAEKRQKTLCDAVLAASGLRHRSHKHFENYGVVKYCTNAELPMALPPTLTEQDWHRVTIRSV